jgi:hypothetical protein
MATYLSTAAIGNREDLTDIIYRISPTQTPVLNLASKTKATATTHEWQTQDLAAASGSNEAAEGADASDKTVTPTVRLTNRTQISTKAVYVSGTQMSGVNPAGRKDELGYQVSLASLELKRDMETALTQNDLSVGGATRRSRGLRGWVVDNVNRNGGTLASYTASGGLGSAYTAGTQRAFVESQVKDVLQQIFTAGGMPDTIMLPPAAKQTFSGFTGNATRMDKSEDSKLYAAVDFYVSDFGTIEAVPNRFMATRDVFILQSDKLAVAYMRPFQTKELAATGDAEKRELIVEWTLECRAPKAHGAVYDIL